MGVRVSHFANFGEALEKIREEEQPNQWLYRGQTHRRDPHQLLIDDKQVEFENLYPGSFRFAASYNSLSEAFDREWQKHHVAAENLFHLFFLYLATEYERTRTDSAAKYSWMDKYNRELRELFQGEGRSLFGEFHRRGIGMRDPEFVRICWALAQHYGIVTALLDVTFDLDIAAWFATNEWSPPEQPRELQGKGIIYRICLLDLQAAILTFNKVYRPPDSEESFAPPPENLFVHDLRHIPLAFARRPLQQQAAVVRGFDDPRFLQLILGTDTVTAFVFDHTDGQSSRWPSSMTREDLIPPSDPFLEFQTTFKMHSSFLEDETELFGQYTKPIAVVSGDQVKLASSGTDPSWVESEVPQALFVVANDLIESGRHDEAAQQFERVVTLAQNQGDGRMVSFGFMGVAAAREAVGNLCGAGMAILDALNRIEGTAEAGWIGEILGCAVEGAARLASKGSGLEALRVFERVLDVSSQLPESPDVQDAASRALFLAGVTGIQEKFSDSALVRLQQAAKYHGKEHTDYQRLFAAAALTEIAKWHEGLAERERAIEFYTQVVSRFANDGSADIHHFVDSARHTIALLMKTDS